MVKFWLYSSASLLACAGLLWYTYATRQQFYPAVIYLVTSKISVLVLGNAGLVLSMLLGRLVKSLFLGQLRDAEVEVRQRFPRFSIKKKKSHPEEEEKQNWKWVPNAKCSWCAAASS